MSNTASQTNLTRAHVLISGKVQGVGFRYFTVQTASQLKLNGWVQNLPDGRVEAVLEGAREVVEEMIRWCHSGSPAAVVESVVVEYEKPEGLCEFQMRRNT
ncbi:acylphosphatase [Calothrix sp. NIES-4101]|nr:acylphosphatase [Calothrix sp. NIES-4101]